MRRVTHPHSVVARGDLVTRPPSVPPEAVTHMEPQRTVRSALSADLHA